MANQELKKKRMLTYFIKAAQDIMNKEGIAGVTLRKVADGAGYNNATLYNYFEDLDHVILFASLKYLSLYNKKAEKSLKGCSSARERFFMYLLCDAIVTLPLHVQRQSGFLFMKDFFPVKINQIANLNFFLCFLPILTYKPD